MADEREGDAIKLTSIVLGKQHNFQQDDELSEHCIDPKLLLSSSDVGVVFFAGIDAEKSHHPNAQAVDVLCWRNVQQVLIEEEC